MTNQELTPIKSTKRVSIAIEKGRNPLEKWTKIETSKWRIEDLHGG